MNKVAIRKAKYTTNKPKTTPEEWIDAARAALIDGGVENVRIDRLAKRLGVTRGGFYYFFESREALLHAVLVDWEQTNQLVPADMPAESPAVARDSLIEINRRWIKEEEYSARYDQAVREWAHNDKNVATLLRTVDDRYIARLQLLFKAMGYRSRVAEMRARILYYHQIGYYALHVHESVSERLQRLPLYVEILIG